VRVRLETVEQRLTAMEQQVERLGSLLRQHGIDPQDGPT
jgi:hypothetical protein